jgi:hypothetical protein
MDDNRIRKRILESKPIGTRIRGRPRKRWIVNVEEDIQIMGIRRWRNQCKEKAEWKKTTEKAKTHSGLYGQSKKMKRLSVHNQVKTFKREKNIYIMLSIQQKM